MDKVSQVTMMANTEVLKEPRGFIKFIEFVIAICAFATTTSYCGTSTYTLKECSNITTAPGAVTMSYCYSFKLDGRYPSCDGDLKIGADLSAPAQFYVFVGVMTFLYTLAALILYVFADDKYHQVDTIPSADLVITVVLVVLWLIASSAWADGLTKLKHYTDPHSLRNATTGSVVSDDMFESASTGSYSGLNVSIIFGFFNMCVWAGNIWFLYKETKWFAEPSQGEPPQSTPAGSPQGYPQSTSQQRI